jgi:membrane-bound ClpP family serine protease
MSTTDATTDATTSPPPVQQDILTNIENLQTLEKELFSKLEQSNDTLTDDQLQELIDQINNISETRIQLYASLGDVNSFYSSNLQSTSTTLNTQTQVIQIVESQLNEYKKRLQNMEEDKWSKLRLVQINYYYSQMYQDHRRFIMWILAAVTIIFIILMLSRYGFLNEFFRIFSSLSSPCLC